MNKVDDLFMTRTRRTFTPEFKLQMVRLFKNEKSKYDIVREYDLTPSTLDKWVKNHQNSGSFNTVDNLTVDEKELRKLCKESRQLKMENDILKQTALIMGKNRSHLKECISIFSISISNVQSPENTKKYLLRLNKTNSKQT